MNKPYYFVESEFEIDPAVRQPASYFRRKFKIEKDVKHAELRMSALGVYIGYLNGIRLSEQELLPGYTDYHYRVQY